MKANQTKETIIQTAIQLFNEKGVSNVTLRMIGAEVSRRGEPTHVRPPEVAPDG